MREPNWDWLDAWREKKASEEANAVINTLLYRHEWKED